MANRIDPVALKHSLNWSHAFPQCAAARCLFSQYLHAQYSLASCLLAMGLLAMGLLALGSCADAEESPPSPDFAIDVRPILRTHCYPCHGDQKQKSGLRLDIKASAMRGGDGEGPSILPNDPYSSPLWQRINHSDRDQRMPPEGPGLSPEELNILREWIAAGAVWPDGIDEASLADPKAHWAFQPLRSFDGEHSIDSWIEKSLHERGLVLSPPALPEQWLRRVTLDLHGLPPSSDELDAFLADPSEGNRERVVDRLLESPRYGERWALHWLDVVRYADTHGFEVNTERPHAWHYRDYVIDALNRDTPYDRFIKEQIAGDGFEQETATGFLITASVLLPGQIGADEPSKRLARQDAIDEIVVNIGQTFLGLTIGCARCHDHKFDPITQEDYYAMQAFVAGVEYGDRVVSTPHAESRKREVESLTENLRSIDDQLARLEPIANPNPPESTTPNATRNEISFDPLVAKWIRLEIFDANVHPDLGKIEPCIDELEAWTDEPTPRNVALATFGTQATASGSRESDLHRLSHVNDGLYGNSHSWMSDTNGRGWVLLELPNPMRISKIVWGRDREGRFQDRLATAWRISAGESLNAMRPLDVEGMRRSAVNPKQNREKIDPVLAKRVRLEIQATNSLEPCIDELEVINTEGVNIALATHGATATSSGDTIVSDRHELRFVNDGVYGNQRSWMSSEVGKGIVTLEFPRPEMIAQFVWGRDRESQFTDRLPTEYRIEVQDMNGTWLVVAGSMDRQPYREGNADSSPAIVGLGFEDQKTASQLERERKGIIRLRKEAIEAQKAFAGIFREPDSIHVLYRGDPEQPREPVSPAVPEFLGAMSLERGAREQQRRSVLADWIASPGNPLTGRVMVNRIWQGHYGTGLVSTPNDFGLNGSPPSHPELLDWLARSWWDDSRWSMKWLHKQIVLSRTYQQSSSPRADALRIDADAKWLWRYPRRRMESESIRDAMLSVSGRLNLKMHGRGFDLFDVRGGLSGFRPVENYRDEGLRRMVYAHKVRREREAIFGAFDCPDAGQSAAARRVSTTPIQALNLFNSVFTLEQSDAFAERVRSLAGEDVAAQIRTAYRLALARPAREEEIAEAIPEVREHGLAVLCRSLFNSNEFLFLP